MPCRHLAYTAQWKKAFGSEIPTDIQTASSFIGPEMIKILSANNGAGTAEERQDYLDGDLQ